MPENRTFVVIDNPNECYWCGNRVEDHEETCFTCGFPQRANEWTQRAWLGNARKKKKEYAANLKWARSQTFFMAGYYVVSGIVSYAFSQDSFEVVVFAAIVAVYIALGFWALKSPFVPLIIGFSIYLFINVLMMVSDPASIVRGIIIKILFIVSYIRAIRFAKTVEPERPTRDDILHD